MLIDHRWRRTLSLAMLAMFCVPAPFVEAALSVSPSRTVHQGKPAGMMRGRFTVENTGPERMEIFVEPEDWAGGISGKREPASWITVRPARLVLKPGKRATVKYTVRIPKTASGELRAQVFFSSRGDGVSSPISRVGAIIYVGIAGTQQLAGEITRVDARYAVGTPGATQPDQLTVSATIRNLGNAHLIPEGTFHIRDDAGRVVATIPLAQGWGLLPGQDERYEAVGHGVHLAPGRYTIDAQLTAGADFAQPIQLTRTVEAMISDTGALSLTE